MNSPIDDLTEPFFRYDLAMRACAVAERAGKAEFFRYARTNAAAAPDPFADAMSRELVNPHESGLEKWAWDLGWRLGEAVPAEGASR